MPPILEHALIFVTNLGDSGLLTVLSFFCAAYLYAAGNIRAALVLTSAALLCLTIMAVLKIYFFGCHEALPFPDIKSPSGHAAMAAAIYGTLAAILAKRFSGNLRWLTFGGALVLTSLIAASRVFLHAHTVPEVLLGLSMGGMVAILSVCFLRPVTHVSFRARYLFLLSFAAALLLYGSRTPAETCLQKIAVLLHENLPFCI